MLLGLALHVANLLALVQFGQRVQLFLVFLVPSFLVDGQEAGEAQILMVGAERMPLAVGVDGRGVIDCIGHLAGHEAAPDQLVEPVLIPGQIRLQGLRVEAHIAGPDGLVCVLRGALGFEAAGCTGVVVLAIAFFNVVLGGGKRFLRQAQGIGTHIGDQTHGALAGDVNALIELLRQRHGALGSHVELTGGLLLERGGNKGGRGRAALLSRLDLADGEELALHVGQDGDCLLIVGERGLFPVFAVVVGLEAAFPVRAFQRYVQGPVFLRHESADLVFAFHHQPGGDGLDAACGETAANLSPEQRRELIAHDAIQNPAGLLGVHQIQVDGSRLLDGLGDDALGDLVEGHAPGFAVGQAQQLLNVPGDGFAFSIRVSCQIDGSGSFCSLFQFLDEIRFFFHRDVFRLEIVIQIHAHRALGQIAQMPHAGLDLIIRAKIFSDCLCLGRRFHDYQIGSLLCQIEIILLSVHIVCLAVGAVFF